MRRRIGPMDLTRDRMVRFVGRAWDQVKSPLYRNAFYIMLAYVVGQALGLVFWVVAYRFYTSNDAGYAIAMLNTLTFLAGVAPLWLGAALGQIRVLGIYMSWSIAFGVSVLAAAFVFIPHAIKGYRPTPRFSRERLRPMFGFSLGNWAAAVIGSAGTLLLPLLIINTLRTNPLGITPSDSTAVFYAATVVAGSLSAIPAATMTSLYAEASQRNAARRRDERRAIALSLGLLVPGILALWFLADVLLRILFDLRPELADLGSPALQILGLASIPVFLNTVFGTRVRIRKQVIPLIVSAAILTAATLVLGYLFLTWFGLLGLAWAVVIGNAASTPYLLLAAGKPIEEETIEPSPIAP